MSDKNNMVPNETEIDLTDVLNGMDQVNTEKEVEVPLFQDFKFERPFANAREEKTERSYAPSFSANLNPTDDECTVIGSSTTIDSNVSCGGNMDIRGHIKGTAQVSGKIQLFGTLDQGAEANEFVAYAGSKITGDINSRTTINILESVVVNGNVSAKEVIIESSITGNIVANELKLKAKAVVTGDITTGSITVETGAIINGHISIKR